ncbi:MAG: putative Ig domain-containing protein, partial [Pirellula sp.]
MAVDPYSGIVSWVPTEEQQGSHSVVIRTIDSQGLFDEQLFTVEVASGSNSPPHFTSTPLPRVTSGNSFEYTSTASDADGDYLLFRKGTVVWPQGYTPSKEHDFSFEYINNGIDQRGIYTWTPPAELSGKTVILEEIVEDGFNAPVKRSFEIYVNPIAGNHPPVITSEPSRNYQLPLDASGYSNPDPVFPNSISVTLGEETRTFQVGISRSALGVLTADIVIVLDVTGSMGYDLDGPNGPARDAISWLWDGVDSVIEQIENKLSEYGFEQNRYGLIMFDSLSQIPAIVNGQQVANRQMAIALGLVGTTSQPIDQIPLANSPEDLWGTAAQLKLALSGIDTSQTDLFEIGHLAIQRLFQLQPPYIATPSGLKQQYPYSFRGDAVSQVVLISDDTVNEFNPALQRSIISSLKGDPSESSDDIGFASIVMSHFRANNGLGNDSPYIERSSGWVIDDASLRIAPVASTNQPGFAIFNTADYPFLPTTPGLPFERGPNYYTIPGLSIQTEFSISDSRSIDGGIARIIFGNTEWNGRELPNDAHYVEANTSTNVWTLHAPNGTTKQFALHAGSEWPDIRVNEPIHAEIRIIPYFEDGDRFDILIGNEPIASAFHEYYPPATAGHTVGSNTYTTYVGLATNQSVVSIDSIDLYTIDRDPNPQTIGPTSPTQYWYNDPLRDTEQIGVRLFSHDFGFKDGSSYDSSVDTGGFGFFGRYIGMDFGGDAYRVSNTTFERVENPGVFYSWSNQESQYIAISEAVQSSVWNLGNLWNTALGSTEHSAFADALTYSIAKEILSKAVSVRADNSAFKLIGPVANSTNANSLQFEVELTGSGSPESFDIEFVKSTSQGNSVIGTIPVWISAPYSHQFEVFDFEIDQPFTIQFDPEYVDPQGQVITHGAQLENTGRESYRNDRLVWNPPNVNQPTNFIFRVIAIDSAGQIGRKNWTVTVYPKQNSNNAPVINTNGLQTDGNHSDGFINEPVLPTAKELRAFQYQVNASDIDPQDQGNLRYHLVPTPKPDGSTIPAPAWLSIDRNTGALSGRPGSNDIGQTHITVVVNDGRFVRNPDGTVGASKTSKTFLLSVAQRDNINTPPYVDAISDLAIRVGETVDLSVRAFDADRDLLTYTLTASPRGATIDSATGRLHWNPALTDMGTLHPFNVKVSDGHTSTSRAFSIHVGQRNQPPKIQGELRDWVTYADYLQPLDVVDPDGDGITLAIVGPQGVTASYHNGTAAIKWATGGADGITPGRHRITVRAFDGAGGMDEQEFMVNFQQYAPPQLISVEHPDWRVGSKGLSKITFLSEAPLSLPLSSSTISFDGASEIAIDYSTSRDEGGYFGGHLYSVLANWTPRFETTIAESLVLTNSIGSVKHELRFQADPFVIQSENDAPVFDSTVIGPFEKDTVSFFNLPVRDPEGQPLDLAAVSLSNGVVASTSNGLLRIDALRAGVHPVLVVATEATPLSVRTTSNIHPIPVDDGAIGTGWLMYSSQSIRSRFPSYTPRAQASDNFIAVRRSQNRWEYNNDANWITFSPRSDDLLVAEVNFDTDSIQSLVGKSGRLDSIAFGFVSSNLTFAANDWNGTADLGEFTIGSSNTTDNAAFTLTTKRSTERVISIAVLDNAAPALIYGELEQPTIGSDFTQVFTVKDPNINDILSVRLNASAIAAGMSIVPQPTSANPFAYALKWKAADIAAWSDGKPHPQKFPISIEVRDNRGESSSLDLSLAVRDPSLGLKLRSSYDTRIPAGRQWNSIFEFENLGGYKVDLNLFAVDGTGASIPLPAGLTFDNVIGKTQWLPSIELLGTGSTRLNEREFRFVMQLTVADHPNPNLRSYIVPFAVDVVDPAIFNPYVPEVDSNVAPPNAATVNQLMVFEPVLKAITEPEHTGAAVQWSLEEKPAGMQVDSRSGRITWTPANEHRDLTIPVSLRVSSTTGSGTSFKFSIKVNSTNLSPMIVSSFPTTWETVTPIDFPVFAIDPEGHELVYAITPVNNTPTNLGIGFHKDPNSQWFVKWNSPTPGFFEFDVRVSEKYNPTYQQTRRLTLRVVNPSVSGARTNLEPLIIGTPQSTTIPSGSEFSYSFGVFDRDQISGQSFTFGISQLPQDGVATVDSTGKFRWTPPANFTGTKSFRLSVTDKSPHAGVADNTRYLTFQLNALHNTAPTISSPSTFTLPVGTEFVHKVIASDLERHALRYRLDGTIPEGMRIDASTGEIRWLVADSTANYTLDNVKVIVTDEYNATSSQTLTLNVSTVDVIAPAVTFYLKDGQGNVIAPGTELLADNFQDYDIWVNIEDNRDLYLPNGTQNGGWYIHAFNTGAQPVTQGKTWLEYAANNAGAPRHGLWKVDLTGTGLNQGLLELNLEVYDHAGNIERRYARYYVNDPATSNTGKILNLNDNSPPITDRFEVIGNALYTTNGVGKYDLKLTTLNDPTDFVYLARNVDALIADSVIGIVDGTQIPTGQYRLYLEVRCSESCIQAVDERIIEVQNVTRFGNLDLSLSDLNVTLGGVTVPIVRTYSSGLVGETDASGNGGGFKSDFSPGWNLNLLQSSVSVSHPKGVTTSLDQAFAKGTRVFVTLPSGEVHRFTFSPVPMGDLFVPRLAPDPEFKSELYLKDFDSSVRFAPNTDRKDGTYIGTNNGKESVPANFGSAWILKTQDGLEYVFDVKTGALESIQTYSGARLEINEESNGDVSVVTRDTGVNNDSPTDPGVKKVVIKREQRPGSTPTKPDFRIVAIEDPVVESGTDKKVLYRYGQFVPSSGSVISSSLDHLAQVELRNGQKSSYTYTNNLLPRHLSEIYDNSNTKVFGAVYYTDVNNDNAITSVDRADDRFGRLQKTTNANSAETGFGFDFDLGNGKKVRSTNVSGNTVEQVLDGRGNTLRVVTLVGDSSDDAQKKYLATVTRYNLRGLQVAQSKPFYITGSVNRFTAEPADPKTKPSEWSTITTYDIEDRKLTVTSADGGVTTYTYDDTNGVFTTNDPFGVTAVRRSDPKTGQLIETYTQAGTPPVRRDHVTYDYDQRGNVTHQWLNYSDGSKTLTSQSFYNGDGFLAWSQHQGASKTYFAYNGNGQQTHSWISVPLGTTPESYATTVSVSYSDDTGVGLPVSTSGIGTVDSASFRIVGTTVYDDSPASVTALMTALGNTAIAKRISEPATVRNARDQVVVSRSMSLDSAGNTFWFISRTVYDAQGRVEYQTDSMRSDVPVSEITGSRTYYDSNGRVWKVEQLKGISISVSNTGNGRGESSVAAGGTVQSFSTTEFDALGRTIKTTQYSTNDLNSGLVSTTRYNIKGQVTETRQEAWNGLGTGKVEFITRTVYDDRDRVLLQTDSYLSTDSIIFGTRTLYDSADRAYGSVRVKGVVVSIDAAGKTTISTAGADQYQTSSFYSVSRLTRSVDALGNVTDTEYDSFGRQTASIGPHVEINGKKVRHRTESVYDDRGRNAEQRSGIIHDESGKGQHDTTQLRRTLFTYDSENRVIRTTHHDGSYAQVRYDALGRKVAESKQVAATVQLVWSESDKSFKNQLNNQLIPTRLTEYDLDGRMSAVALPAVADPLNANAVTRPRYQYGYSLSGQQSLIVDPYGHETRLAFDAFGRQVSRTLPLGFGVDGKLGTTDDSAAEAFSEYEQYDSRGRKSLHISFEGVHEQNIYDDKTGRLTESRYSPHASAFANGTSSEVRKFSFDNRGRTNKIEHFVGGVSRRIETMEFDDEGKLYETMNREGKVRYTYDVHGRMTRKEWSSTAFMPTSQHAFENTLDYTYDELGRLKTVVQRDRGGVTLGTSDVTAYKYTLDGLLDTTRYHNGLIHDNDYDSLGRLKKLTHWVDLNADGKQQSSENRATFDYTVRADGKRTKVVESIKDGTTPVVSNEFIWEYDAVDRLISETLTDQYDLDWIYDLAGNRRT